MTYTIHQGDNRDILKTLPDNSVDSIVTDPPYGIDFLGKAWDINTGELETYQECLRVLKPGGHILAFSAARTYHHLAMTLERAGFEIRDQIMWIYSSGFPKSQDVGKSIERTQGLRTKTKRVVDVRPEYSHGTKGYCKDCGLSMNGTNHKKCTREECGFKQHLKPADNEWAGWGTALKPAHEPICLARKPLKQSIAQNVQEWGVGALNIDATRIPFQNNKDKQASRFGQDTTINPFLRMHVDQQEQHTANSLSDPNELGRFPSNVIGEIQEEYQKYFYCPKVSRAERHVGFDTADIPTNPNGILDNKDENGNQVLAIDSKRLGMEPGNNHPTVKPIELMKYLIKLITPPGGTVLDPYNGSGSTGMAAVELGFDYIGCELDPNYVAISHKRISSWRNNERFDSLFDWGDE